MSYGAADSPTYYIDISPFIGQLSDDQPHNLSIGVAGMGVNYSINSNWFVSGNVQIMLDPSGGRSMGQILSYHAQPHADTSVKGLATLTNELRVHTSAKRSLAITGSIRSASGRVMVVDWTQTYQVCTCSSDFGLPVVELHSFANSVSRDYLVLKFWGLPYFSTCEHFYTGKCWVDSLNNCQRWPRHDRVRWWRKGVTEPRGPFTTPFQCYWTITTTLLLLGLFTSYQEISAISCSTIITSR